MSELAGTFGIHELSKAAGFAGTMRLTLRPGMRPSRIRISRFGL